MLVIGLTGGIGVGKSTVAQFFAELGVTVIDADEVGRDLVRCGEPALAEIVRVFGAGVLDPNGSLDRARLRARVFKDPAALGTLEAILHPRILREMRCRVTSLDGPYCILAIPLLVEKGLFELVDRVLVVDAPPELQRARTSARDGTNPDEIQTIMDKQADRQTRLNAADDVIVNDGDLFALRAAVRRQHRQYLLLTQQGAS